MAFNLEEVTQKLLSHPYFEKAKHVKELGPGHPEDSVFIHLTQTSDVVRQKVSGDFIQNPDAKKLFLEVMNKDIDGNPYKEVAVVVGLVHDIGKILSYTENGEVFPMSIIKPNTETSYSPNHAKYGADLVKELLAELGLSEKVVTYIAEVVRVHMMIFDFYKRTEGYTLLETINDIKPFMEGYHVEVALNAIGDINSNPPLEKCKELIYKMLEEPKFYYPREYFVA